MELRPSITAFGFEPLMSALGRTVSGASDLREMKDALRGEYTRANEENLLGEGALVGGWQELSRRTVQDKRRKGFGAKRIEERTEKLFRSLTEPGAEGFFEEVGREEIVFGSRIFYAARQHRGDEAANLPARELIPRLRREAYAAIHHDHAAEVARVSGFRVV